VGNGHGLIYGSQASIKVNGEEVAVSPTLTSEKIEAAALAAANNHGAPAIMFIPISFQMMAIWEAHPEYSGTPWSQYARLTKRETAVAKIHTFLNKLGTLSFNEEEFNKVCSLSAKRLKRAKWAQYRNLVK